MFLGRDVLLAGVATHYCEFARLKELEDALLACSNSSEVEGILSKYCPVDPTAKFCLEDKMKQINSCFAAGTVEEIVANLERDNTEWAQTALKVIRSVYIIFILLKSDF